MALRVLRRGDCAEPAFFSALVEDRSPAAGMSYVEYLCSLHRQIQSRVS
jgi:protein transport protein SEC24